jgi:hypothetical protein
MKHIKLFESFLSDQDKEAVEMILAVSNEPWFMDGDDAPSGFVDSLEGMQIKNPEILNAIEVCASGPGYTDVWIERNELIADVLSEEPDVTEEEIEDSNRNWFAEERAYLVRNLRKYLS